MAEIEMKTTDLAGHRKKNEKFLVHSEEEAQMLENQGVYERVQAPKAANKEADPSKK